MHRVIPELRLAHADLGALEADHRDNLRRARAFVTGAEGPSERERCQLVIEHPVSKATFALDAEVVWVKREPPGAGVGVQLVHFHEARRADLHRFVHEPVATPSVAPSAKRREGPDGEPERDEGDASAAPGGSRNIHERVRALGIGDRLIMARQGTLPERIALERAFGNAVWEALLQNPQLSPPEVSRIAKNGLITRPLVQLIVKNPAWLAVPEIARALLTNPRVGGPHLDRVLRALPRSDLEGAVRMTAYRLEVRQAAARIVGKAR
jgi:hypothetical protein